MADAAFIGLAMTATGGIIATCGFVIKASISFGRHMMQFDETMRIVEKIPMIERDVLVIKDAVEHLSPRVARHDSEIHELHRKHAYLDGERASQGEFD